VNGAGNSGWEDRRLAALQKFERFFFRLALFGVGISIVGFVAGAFLSNAASAIVISMFGFGGLLIAAMSLVIRKRIRTGPKAQY